MFFIMSLHQDIIRELLRSNSTCSSLVLDILHGGGIHHIFDSSRELVVKIKMSCHLLSALDCWLLDYDRYYLIATHS
jgi:hypothetical protein